MDFRPDPPRPFGDFKNPLRTRGDLGENPLNKIRIFYTNFKTLKIKSFANSEVFRVTMKFRKKTIAVE